MAKARKPMKRAKQTVQAPATCYFCKENKDPDYADTSVLTRFTSDRGKIVSRTRSGLCGKHQKRLADAVKYARHLALLPFIIRE